MTCLFARFVFLFDFFVFLLCVFFSPPLLCVVYWALALTLSLRPTDRSFIRLHSKISLLQIHSPLTLKLALSSTIYSVVFWLTNWEEQRPTKKKWIYSTLYFFVCVALSCARSLLIEPTKQWKMQMYANCVCCCWCCCLVWYGNDCLRCQRGDYVDVIVNGCVPFRFVLSYARLNIYSHSLDFSTAERKISFRWWERECVNARVSVVCELVLKCSKNMFFSFTEVPSKSDIA